MNQDKILKDYFQQTTEVPLSSGFNDRLMLKINEELVRRRRRQTVLSYLLVSVVSVGIVMLSCFLLRDYLSGEFLRKLKELLLISVSDSMLKFSVYIGLIVLFLLSLDMYFRKKREKYLNKSI